MATLVPVAITGKTGFVGGFSGRARIWEEASGLRGVCRCGRWACFPGCLAGIPGTARDPASNAPLGCLSGGLWSWTVWGVF